MSLEFDPEFVDTKVQLLESDIARLESSFVLTSGRVLDIDNKIAYKASYLRCSLVIIHHHILLTTTDNPSLSLLEDRIASLTQMEHSVVRAELTNQRPSF